MSKLKTKKGVVKRMKLTKRGKIRRYPAKKGHLRAEKSSKKRRQHKKPMIVTGVVARTIKLLIGG